MYSATEELNKASNILLDAEIALNSITVQVESLERQIALMNSTEANLEENIRMLKKSNIIVVLTEYLRSKIDLKTIRNRRSFLVLDLSKQLKIQKNCEIVHEKSKLEYFLAFKRARFPESNIIQGNFRRKDDGQK